jgi:sugar fermentation stimulation protein A
LIDGEKTICHVRNTGRLKELLTEKALVYLEKSSNPKRKTSCSLISVKKGNQIINIDSQIPNKVFHEALSSGRILLPGVEKINHIKSESRYGSSRFDFYIESGNTKAYIEIKGVTLEENGVVRFPDAPTTRGVKHIYELVNAKKDGFNAYIVFIIQMNNVKYFTPNDKTHKEFGDVLRYAKSQGVAILAYKSDVTPDSIELNGKRCKVIL